MLKNISVRYGALAGLVTILYFLFFYAIGKRLMLSSGVSWGSFAIFVVFMVMACRQEAKERDAFSFQEALRTAFLVFIVADVIYYLFYYVLHGLIDPELVAIQREMMLETSQWLAENLGAGELQQDIESLGEEDLRISPGSLLLSLSWSLIGGFIISLIIAGVNKR